MNRLLLASAGLAVTALIGCAPPHARLNHGQAVLKPVARLDCPQSADDLSRTDAASDGRSCAYSGPDGEQVTLKLVSFTGDPETALEPMESELKAVLPPPAEAKAPEPPEAPAPPKAPRGPTPPQPPAPPMSGAGDRNKHVNIDLPGVHIHADDKTDTAHITGGTGPFGHGGGQFSVDANGGIAIIRTRNPGPDVRRRLIIASDKASPEGWRSTGYIAWGPKSGPLVVATVKSKAQEHDDVFRNVEALVKRNFAG